MERVLVRLIKKIQSVNASREVWGYFDGNGQLRIHCGPGFKFFNLTEEEVEDCATASCGPTLWVFRAIGARWGVPIRTVDWVYYNTP